MSQLKELQVFVRVVEAGGIGKAAEQMGIAKSAVSQRLVKLEKRMGVRLLNRTTRRSHLTEAGQRCYQQSLNILNAVSELHTVVCEQEQELQGVLKIAAPLVFGRHHLVRVVDQFTRLHPKLLLDIDLSDRYVNLIESGRDMAIRIGSLPDSTLQARRIASANGMLVASPDYLERYGTPETPEDLKDHALLQYETSRGSAVRLRDRQGTTISYSMKPRLIANNGDFLNEMAILGQGIVLSPTFICWQDVQEGRLVQVLPDYDVPIGGIYAVYPENRFVSRPLRSFIDYLVEVLGDSPHWDNPKETCRVFEQQTPCKG
ncbi:LysR family transcriptional regulator [Endozoicomonas lisbonensis]|uniref:DNA-binding transcriptional LysR family regulator n=1 Tax=Endozoicomonas lisbonensis TaxID=3120522 RepID=A0ABV2SKL9_9GAMM